MSKAHRGCFLSLVAGYLWLVPAVGQAQDRPPDADPAAQWLEIQADSDPRVKEAWWRGLDPGRLDAFISAGADVDATDGRGWTPLHSAARFTPNEAVLVALLDAGALVDARDRAGDTPLHWAAAENPNVRIVTLLIEAGADVNSVDRYGWVPLHAAAESSSNPEIIDALVAAGAERERRAYFVLFSPDFLLANNTNMSEAEKKLARESLRGAR